MELLARVEQLELELKRLRPALHFPSTATLEQRLRWLEIVYEEMRARDNYGVYAETPGEEKLRQILAHTVYIKSDRITLMGMTADPASCAAGDQWFRSDSGKAKLAIDAVVANAKLLRREGDTIPAAEIASLDAAKIGSGRFGLARMPDSTLNYVLTAQGAGVDPAYAAVAAAPPLLAPLFRTNAATGTFQTNPAAINDNDTATTALAGAVDQYAEVNLGRDFLIYQYRQYGNVDNTGNGVWKIQYYDTAWHDWITGIPIRITADWSAWAHGTIVIANKIRLVCTTVDNVGTSRIRELEVAYVQSA